ncbi:hypothetical protein AB6A40_000834 [Gnathostoma spinigerum]|uniref:Uncharacterized protein n=1 Tax=Gnathostoma spinigerum TaxID=75299 RepID=A0ABD6E3V2_9BILA
MLYHHLLILTLYVGTVLAVCPSFMRNQTACSCFAYIDGLVIKCDGPDGPSVVEQLKQSPKEIRELSIENANIVEIGRYAFRNLRIKKLVLDNNRIRAINPDAFRGLEFVMLELSIAMNKLTAIPTDSLIAMRALSVLNLRCNNIGDITQPAFRNLSSLIDLNLGCNQICNIEGAVFDDVKQTLQNLILDHNCLTSFPSESVNHLDNLIALHIKYNQLETLEKHQLGNMTSLTILTLTGNKIRSIDKEFAIGLDNLKYLYLGNNNITSLEAEVMGQFTQAQVIELSFNGLAEVTADMFSGLEHLQHLNLDGNNIRDIAPGAFATTPLLLLWLPNNCLSSVAPNMFLGAPFLRQISLANNNIRTIQPLSFAHLANLHTLDLSLNKLKSLQSGAITGSDHLTVRLQENPMVCSQDGFHVMNGREAINLTTEPNLICKTDYLKDVKDDCPKGNSKKPQAPVCCSRTKKIKTSISESLQETIKQEILQPSTTAKPNDADLMNMPISSKKKFNLERFLRLSQKPKDLKLNPTIHRQNQKNDQLPRQEQQPHEQPKLAVTKVNNAGASSPSLRFSKVENQRPARINERRRLIEKNKFPAWMRTRPKDKSKDDMEFSTDKHVETVQSPDLNIRRKV